MPKGPQGQKRSGDVIGTAITVAMIATGELRLCRFTRLTKAFSKKLDNHIHALGPYFTFYYFTQINKSLKVAPAMAAGITDRLWTMEDIVAAIDARAELPK